MGSGTESWIWIKEPLNSCHSEQSEKSILLIAKDSSLRSE